MSILFLLALTSPAVTQDKGDELAREATLQFLKAVKAEDVDAVMKVCDVPFFMDSEKVFKDTSELRKEVAKHFDEKDLTNIEYELKEVHIYDKVKEKLNEREREMMQTVLAGTDRVVAIQVKTGDKTERVAIMVRIRDGKARVVGLKD